MKLSWFKIITFFIVVFIVGWFLYPREFFLAYISEGESELTKAANYYHRFLDEKPYDKKAVIRLANLYERMGEPEKAKDILHRLYVYRHQDWEFAKFYIEYLDNMLDYKSAYKIRRDAYQRFKDSRKVSPKDLKDLLEDSLEYTLWQQDQDASYEVLRNLVSKSSDPGEYTDMLAYIDKGLKKTDRLVIFLKKRIKKNPNDLSAYLELIDVYRVVHQNKAAVQQFKTAVKKFPKNQNLLESGIALYSENKMWEEAIELCQKLLKLPRLPKSLIVEYRQKLASFYLQSGKRKYALNILKDVLATNQNDKNIWQTVIGIYQEGRETDRAITLLESYLEKFPDDTDQRKNLSEIYLYEKKDLQKLGLYYQHVKDTSNLNFAKDVAYLLSNRTQYNINLRWLNQVYPLFPYDPDLALLKLETLMQLKKYRVAKQFIGPYIQNYKTNEALLIKAIELYGLLQDRKQTIALLSNLAESTSNDPKILKFVGRELYFIGATTQAISYLEAALEHTPNDLSLWHYLSESHFASEHKKSGLSAAEQVVSLVKNPEGLKALEYQMWLKSKGRISFNKEVDKLYQAALLKYSKNIYLRIDYIDFLLEKKKKKKAKNEILSALNDFPTEKQTLEAYQARLAILYRNWGTALQHYKNILKRNPRSWYVRRDMATILSQIGEWPKAIRELRKIESATGNEYKVKPLLQQLRDLHDNKVYSEYNITDLGGSHFMKGTLGTRFHISKNLKINTKYTLGHFSANATTKTHQAEVKLTYSQSRVFSLSLGAGVGISPNRKSPSGIIQADYQPFEQFSMTARLKYRYLRTDLSSAPLSGALQDTAELQWTYQPYSRVNISGRYQFSRSYLKNGASSLENRFEPQINFVLFEKPYITLGYQLTLSDATNKNSFFNQVSLIPSSQAHYLTAFFSHSFDDRLRTEMGFFVGEDVKRNLRLFHGELWGANANLVWQMTEKLELKAAYTFGQETITGIGGQSHQFNLGITGYWDSWLSRKQ